MFGSLDSCAIGDVVHKGHPTNVMGIEDPFSGTGCVNDKAHPSSSDVDMNVSWIFNVHARVMEP